MLPRHAAARSERLPSPGTDRSSKQTGYAEAPGDTTACDPTRTSRSPLTCSDQATGQVMVCRLPALATFAESPNRSVGRGRNKAMTWSGARDRPASIGGLGDKVASERAASALWTLLRRPSTAAVGAGRPGPGSHSVAMLVERPGSLGEHDCLAVGATYNGW